jgi:hypothetical protein
VYVPNCGLTIASKNDATQVKAKIFINRNKTEKLEILASEQFPNPTGKW